MRAFLRTIAMRQKPFFFFFFFFGIQTGNAARWEDYLRTV